MASSPWQLDQHRGRLRIAPLAAAIDVSNPAVGLTGLCLSGNPFPDARVLGIAMPSCSAGRADSLVECFVRGSLLAADYKAPEHWPVRVEAVWRAGCPSEPNGALAMIDLVISVRTHRLDSKPELSVQSVLPAVDVLRLADPDTARFDSIGREGPRTLHPDGGPGCLLFRFPASESCLRRGRSTTSRRGRETVPFSRRENRDSPQGIPRPLLSYAEMVHPTDFVEDRLSVVDETAPSVELRHRLFPKPLEKGVLLRARVRGVLCRRDDDAQTVAQCYAAFREAEPPLNC